MNHETALQPLDQIDLPALLDRQRSLEDNAMALGKERFRRRIEEAEKAGKASTVGAARKLLQTAIVPLAAAIKLMVDETEGRRGRKHFAVKWCREKCEACAAEERQSKKTVVCSHAIGSDVAAYMTVKVCLDSITKQASLYNAANDVADLILDELRYRRFQQEAPGLFDYKVRGFTTSNYAHMARSMDASMRFAKIDTSDLTMTPEVRQHVGTKLIDLFVQSSGGMVQIEEHTLPRRSARDHNRTIKTLVASPDTLKWLNARNGALEFLWPVNLPMVVPPLPWAPGQRGGYRFALRNKYSLVRGASREHQERVAQNEMPVVYSALNRIQETAWAINPNVLALLFEIVRRGKGGFAGVPRLSSFELPPKPRTVDAFEAQLAQWRKERDAARQAGREEPALPADVAAYRDEWKAWKRAAAEVKEENAKRKVAVNAFDDLLRLAKQFAGERALFFPYNVDFRGRIYPITAGLNPQGDDLAKALLTFAQGKPMTEDGAGFLAVHLANSLEVDPNDPTVKLTKATITERQQWVLNNTARIRQVAREPLADLWWADADAPLQFFAACVEWDNYLTALTEGREYVCALPVASDGTCNGLQHFSAMLLDEVGGAAVNVTATSRPQDIYSNIADDVLDMLQAKAASESVALQWLNTGLVNRKLAKRPTMTFGYGSKKFGFKSQLVEFLQGLGSKKYKSLKAHFVDADGKSALPAACGFMAGLIWDALGVRVRGAFAGMAWMQKAARGVVANGLCVEWRVPATGFLVKQEYMRTTKKQVRTILAGKVYTPTVYEPTMDPDPVKQANAVAPNFVHSLDAAALMLTVDASSAEGVEFFGMVHDSYATLPADAPILARCTRESFYRLYTERDVLADFAAQLRVNHATPEEFPELPAKGALDLSEVLVSEYFFS